MASSSPSSQDAKVYSTSGSGQVDAGAGGSMAHRIELEVGKRERSTLKELILDNCARVQTLVGLNDEFTSLQVLSIVNVGLTSLIGFPSLLSLKKLILSDNRLSGGLEHLGGCHNLEHLDLAGNKFKAVEDLAPLAKLTKLVLLDVMTCPLTSTDNYTQAIFGLLPQVKYLDNVDKDGHEKEESDGEDEDDEGGAGDDNEGEEVAATRNGADEEGNGEEDEEYEEDDSKHGLKALYDQTLNEGESDDEEDYVAEGNEEDEDESPAEEEDDEVSEVDASGGNNASSAALANLDEDGGLASASASAGADEQNIISEVSTTTTTVTTTSICVLKGEKRKRGMNGHASDAIDGSGDHGDAEVEEEEEGEPPHKI